MKKTLTLIICIVSLHVFSQSFHKGALVFDANTGIDVYGVKYHYQLKNTNTTHDESNGAAAYNFNFGLEYGLFNWLGVGLRGKFDHYFTSQDSTTHTTPTVKGYEIALLVNAHVVHTNHFDLPIGFDLGYSHLNYFENDISNNQIYGNGSYFNIHINPRFYIGRFGFNINTAVPFINYSNMTSNNAIYNQYILANWKAVGFSFGFGVQYRFLKAK
jgi:hypothetical protein